MPGLFIGQHAGGGKAEQIFLRGFDIDHGTDINLTVDGLPVNMVSHAHEQGYADLHFVIPETLEQIDFGKGPYNQNKGNFALSVSLTAITSFVSILSIPFILSYAIDYFGAGSGVEIKLPIGDTILQIMVITVIPISIGMFIRRLNKVFADRAERPMRIASTVLFILVFIAVIVANLDVIGTAMKEVGLVTLLLNVGTMALGFFSAKLFKLSFNNAVSITIESGIQNGTLAIVIATTILNNLEMGVPTAAYAIWMFATGGLLMWKLGRKKDPAKA